MPQYHRTTVVDREVAQTDGTRCFETLKSAQDGARYALDQIAADRLLGGDCEFITVEIFDDDKTPITELRLEFREVVK